MQAMGEDTSKLTGRGTPQAGDTSRGRSRQDGFDGDDPDPRAKTGTTTVGLKTTDGVVLASDMRASLGGEFVLNKDLQKVEQIHPTGALTLVGLIGSAQAFIRTMRSEAKLYEMRRGQPMGIRSLQSLAASILQDGDFDRINPIIGGVDDEGSHVASIDPAGGVLEDDYTATGSGMSVAFGHLENTYERDITNDEAVGLAATAVEAAVNCDGASGDGLVVARISESGVEVQRLDEAEQWPTG